MLCGNQFHDFLLWDPFQVLRIFLWGSFALQSMLFFGLHQIMTVSTQKYSAKTVVSAVSAILLALYWTIGVKKLSHHLFFNRTFIYGDELWVVIERIRCCLSFFHLIIKSNFRDQLRLTGHTPLVGDHGLTQSMLSRAGPGSPWIPQEKLENIIRQQENWNTFLKRQMLFKLVLKCQEKFCELVCKC